MALDKKLLQEHLDKWKKKLSVSPDSARKDHEERVERARYYSSFTAERIGAMTKEELLEFLSRLWAMRMWGNKQHVVDKFLEKHSLETIRSNLNDLVWGSRPIEERWNEFRANISGVGPAMMSEILCHIHPQEYLLWNRRAFVSLRYLGIEDLPRYNHQITGEKYVTLCEVGKAIANEMRRVGFTDVNLLMVDYFLWDELQVEENLSDLHPKVVSVKPATEIEVPSSDEGKIFLHDEVKEKLANIGEWLGFKSETEVKVADGSVVDTVWQATIGNMGRVIYVFEVQTKGSIDSLIINLLKSLNNPAVQGVVAVSDKDQLEKIKKHAEGVRQLHDKLKYWNYQEVLAVHESLESVNEVINGLRLVPQGFGTD